MMTGALLFTQRGGEDRGQCRSKMRTGASGPSASLRPNTSRGTGGPMIGSNRVDRAAQAAYVAAGSGLVALVTIGLFFTVGQPFGTLNDFSLLVMTLAIVPVMLGFYELGGRTPIGPARVSLATGITAVVAWSTVQAAMIVGLVRFDYEHGAIDWFAVESVALAVIGLWLAGATLLAGPWLPPVLRWIGAFCGLEFVLIAAGMLLGGVNHPLTYLGGVGYQLLFPAWAYLLGQRLARQRRDL